MQQLFLSFHTVQGFELAEFEQASGGQMRTLILPFNLDSEIFVSSLGPQFYAPWTPWPQARLPGFRPCLATDLCPQNSPWSCPDFPVS